MVEQSELVQDLVYTVQCQFCLFCAGKQCRLDSNFGKGETKLVEDCSQLAVAGEDT